jgi:lysophospholipase L1-like esterase
MDKNLEGKWMVRRFLMISVLLPGIALAQEDWAALGRFAAENAALGAPDRREERVVFLGDSITQGWSDAAPEYFANKAYVERGIGGQTTPQMLIRFRADVVDLEPEAVVILAGTNDIAGNTGPATNKMIMDNLASMAEIAAANDIRVVLASILPAFDYPWSPGLEPAPRIREINAWLEQYAEDNDHVYLDYYTALADDRGGMQSRYTTDGVHVTRAGYAVMASLAEVAIDEALSRPRSQPGVVLFTPIQGCARTTGNRRSRGCDD